MRPVFLISVSMLCMTLIASQTHGDQQYSVVQPTEIDDLLANPGIGWETFLRPAAEDTNLPEWIPSTIQYIRWGWKQLEPEPSRINTDLLDCALRRSRASGQQLAFRVKCCNPDKHAPDHPAWVTHAGGRELNVEYGGIAGITIPDMDDPVVLKHHLDFIARLGARYDGHADLAHVDLGSIGWWGEWHMSNCTGAALPSLATRTRIIDAYMKAFQKTLVLMPLGGGHECLADAAERGVGWRADSLGDLGSFSQSWNHMRDIYPKVIRDQKLDAVWKRSPIAFEPPKTPTEFVEREWPLRGIFNYALALHGSTFNGKSAPLPDDEDFNRELRRFLRRLGYRFVLREISFPTKVRRAAEVRLAMRWQNVGSAPCYRPYHVAFRLRHGAGEQVFVSWISVDRWMPGSVPLFTDAFPHATPDLPSGPVDVCTDRFVVPDDFPAGEAELAIAVVDACTRQPVVRLAIDGRDKDGWYPVGILSIAP
jgi:hypothetical protein